MTLPLKRRALLAELRMRVELARDTYAHAREDGVDRVTAGLAALRAAAQRHGLDREHRFDAADEHAQGMQWKRKGRLIRWYLAPGVWSSVLFGSAGVR